MQILKLHEAGRSDLERVGGKGANLGEMMRLGLPVPPGFVIPAQAYRHHLGPDLAPDEMARRLARAPLDPALEQAILRAYHDMGSPPVAVRSSATAEDLADASFAGQQETFLNVRGDAALLQAVRQCWASLWSPRAVHYRERRGIDHRQVAMAVVVQEMVPARAAGVLFTVDPVSRRNDQMLIEAAPGLGEAVVSGDVTGDTYRIVRPLPGEAAAAPAPAAGAARPAAAPGAAGPTAAAGAAHAAALAVAGREVHNPDRPVLTDAQALAIARLGLQLEQHFGCPQDVEFALAGGQIYLLQSRPITTLPAVEPEPVPEPRLDRLQRLMLPMGRERYPLAPRPLDNLMFAIVVDSITHSVRQAGFAISPEAEAQLEQQLWRPIYASFPPSRPTLRALNPAYSLGLLRRDWQSRWDREFAPGLVALGRLADGLESLSDHELFQRAERIRSELTPMLRWRMTFVSAQFAESWLKGLVALAVGPRQAAWVTRDLLAGLSTRTTETNAALWALSREARRHPEVARAVAAGRPETLGSFPAGRAFLERFTAFLAGHGHREGSTWYLSTPTWRQEPAQVWQLLQGLVAVEMPPADGRERYAAARRRVYSGLWWLPFLRRPCRWLTERLRLLHQFRENSHFDLTRPLAVLQALAAEWARRLLERGLLARPDDIFYLTYDEVRGWLLGEPPPPGPAEARALIARRRATYDLVNARWQADVFRAAVGGPELRGVPASPGVVRGRVRVVRSEADWHRLRPGEVMVCPFTNPAWTPLFAVAAAVVTETGGAAAHAAIVAREYGIPAVMGVAGATGRLVDGQEVLVDGGAGRVVPGPAPEAEGAAPGA